jgi:hypothetical protein
MTIKGVTYVNFVEKVILPLIAYSENLSNGLIVNSIPTKIPNENTLASSQRRETFSLPRMLNVVLDQKYFF